MRKRLVLLMPAVAIALLQIAGLQAATRQATPNADTAKFTGTWSGTFDGGNAGKLVVTLDAATETPTGTLSATLSEGGGHEVNFKTLTLTKNTLKAGYEVPDDGTYVTLAGTLSGDTIKGTWAAGEGTGTWTVTRQAKP